MHQKSPHVCLLTVALACGQWLSSEAAAQTTAPTAAAVDRCQPALPTFDGSIRKRPKAVQNEGTSIAFITCGFSGDNFAANDDGIYYAAA